MILQVAEKLFELISNTRHKLYVNNIFKSYKLSIPVISIGNITVGGTGKTPLAIELIKLLINNNYKPIYISRGYGRKSNIQVHCKNGDKVILGEVGDEAYMIHKLTGVDLCISNKKWQAALYIESLKDYDVVILDDGFQHFKIKRDLDIVLIDKQTLKEEHLIPKGRLRDKIIALNRADILLYYNDIEDDLLLNIKEYVNNSHLINTESKGLIDIEGKLNLFTFVENCVAVSGIANPNRFWDSLQSNNILILDKLTFTDHHNYSIKDVEKIVDKAIKNNCKNIVTTLKDIYKILEYNDILKVNNVKLYALDYSISLSTNVEKLILSKLSINGVSNV